MSLTNKLRDSLLKRSGNVLLADFHKLDVPFVLRTDLLSYDIRMFRNAEGTDCGYKYGTINEILGKEGSLKTAMMLRLAAKHLTQNQDSLVYFFNAEASVSEKYLFKALRMNGYNPTDLSESEYPFVIKNTNSINEIQMDLHDLWNTLDEIANEERKKPGNATKPTWQLVPRVMIALDSLAALTNNYDKSGHEDLLKKALKKQDESVTDEHSARVGYHAGLLHILFKSLIHTLNKYGAIFIYTNQYRSNLSAKGPFAKKTVPAHDSATKYWNHSRQEYSPYGSLDKYTMTKNGDKLKIGQPLSIQFSKLRESTISKEVELDYYYETGFDEVASFIDGLVSCDILRKRGADYTFQEDLSYCEELKEQLADKFDSKGKAIKYSIDDLREMFKDAYLEDLLDVHCRKKIAVLMSDIVELEARIIEEDFIL